jgi:hypothetical protein
VLTCEGAKLKNAGGDALSCDGVRVIGNVFLRGGFEADGEVRFSGAEIGGDLACNGGHFRNAWAAKWSYPQEKPLADYALNLSSVRIAGVLWLGPATADYRQVEIQGSVNLQGAFAGQFADDPESWPKATVETESGALPCHIHLDGFTYGRFRGAAKTDWGTRAAWLKRQRPLHLGEQFRPQPFEQLAKVLREMGHEADARQIQMLKHSYLQKRKKFWKQTVAWTLGWLWGIFCGYGYRAERLAGTLIALWLAFGALYQFGAAHGGFAPKDARLWASTEFQECHANWTECGKIAANLGFSPLLYSADVMLPAIDFGQRAAWTPALKEIEVEAPRIGAVALPKGTLRAAMWLENILGVTGVILLGGILSGVIKRD